MSTLTPQEVADLMSIYAARPCPVNEALPRQTNLGIHLFDRGHYRQLYVRGADVQRDTNGIFCVVKGEKIYLTDTGRFPQYIPVGFYPVPERVVLKYFASDAGVNAFKMENALLEYKRAHDNWFRNEPRQNPKPRRPTLRQLKLGRGSEFENFIQPLILGYSERLKENFEYCLDLIDQNRDVFTAVNDLYLPDTDQNGVRYDGFVTRRWDNALLVGATSVHKYIYVRMDNFSGLSTEPDVNEAVPMGIQPFPPAPRPTITAPAPPQPAPRDIDVDEKLLGLHCEDGGAFKNDFLRMTPWQSAQRTSNPFRSREYRYAWALVQHGFELKYAKFKAKMEQKRDNHAMQWAMYKAYRNAQEAYAYTRVTPNVQYAERPQVENFNLEWKQFIFGLREEMKYVRFDKILNIRPVEDSVREDRRNFPILGGGNSVALHPKMLMI